METDRPAAQPRPDAQPKPDPWPRRQPCRSPIRRRCRRTRSPRPPRRPPALALGRQVTGPDPRYDRLMRTTAELREGFLSFFEANEHLRFPVGVP